MARLETWYKQDLKRPLVVHKHTDVFNQDSKGNLIGVEVYSDGEPVVLVGSISGYCLLADGTTVPAVGASRSGNKASVLIPQTAYSVPGPITITIKNVDGDNIATLCATVGVVRQSVSGSLVNPGSVVTDWSNNINAQLQAVQTAADNVGAIVAAPFDENTVYVDGNYVTNNGNLYRITADHAVGVSWADTSKVQCTVGSELYDLKSAINNIVPLPIDSWIPNYMIQCPTSAAVGDEISLDPVANSSMAYMIIDVVAGDTFIATGRATSGYIGWFQVDINNKCVQIGSTIYNNTTIVISEPGKLVLNANRNNAYSAYKGTNKVEENRNLINSLQSTVEKTTVDDESVLFSLYRKEYKVVKTNTTISLAGKAVGDTLDLTPSALANFGYLIIPCTDNETFILTANAGTNNHPWACLDANNVILSIASGAIVTKATIITPANTAKLVIRANCNSTVLVVRGSGIVNDLNGEEQILSLTVAAGYWTVNGSGGSASSYRRTMDSIFFRAGTTFKIYAGAGGSATTGALITEWDASGNFIQTLVGNSYENVQKVYTLDHDAYIRFSYKNSYGFNGMVTLPASSEVMSAVSNTQGAVANAMYEWERVLNSVCCIGDSLTRGAYYVNGHDGSAIEQNYPYFFAKQTGLTVQNEGMSGSSPSSRWNYFSTFDFTPYNAFFIWWGTNGGLTDTLEADDVIDEQGNLIADYTTYADTNTGDYCKVIGRIISQVPHSKIFLGTIFTTGGDLGATNEVIAKIAALYPNNVVGVVDNNDGTLYTLASKRLTPAWVHIDNGTHFSMVGNYYLAVHWIKAVRAIIAANPAKFEDIIEDILT